jgi:hypothetical protein
MTQFQENNLKQSQKFILQSQLTTIHFKNCNDEIWAMHERPANTDIKELDWSQVTEIIERLTAKNFKLIY